MLSSHGTSDYKVFLIQPLLTTLFISCLLSFLYWNPLCSHNDFLTWIRAPSVPIPHITSRFPCFYYFSWLSFPSLLCHLSFLSVFQPQLPSAWLSMFLMVIFSNPKDLRMQGPFQDAMELCPGRGFLLGINAPENWFFSCLANICFSNL